MPMKAFLSLIMFLFLFHPALARGQASIVSMRAGVHRGFHRFVIELSEGVGFYLKRDGAKVSVRMRGTPAVYQMKDAPSTELVKVSGLREEKDGNSASASLDLVLKDGAEVKESTRKDPFRIVLDIYPDGTKKAPGSAQARSMKGEKAATLKADLKTGQKKSDRGSGRLQAFNDGWRWTCRKKAMALLRKDIDDTIKLNQVFAAALGIPGSDRDELIKGAQAVEAEFTSRGEVEKARLLSGLIRLFSDGKDEGLEELLLATRDPGLAGLGYFLLGDNHEKRGFYPEAAGYYSRAAADKNEGPVRSAALFMKARLQFFEGKAEEARDSFAKAARSGYAEAAPWLGNTYLAKGEFDRAWQYYDEAGIKAGEGDPVTRMGIGDLYIMRKRFDEARATFENLRSKYSDNEFLSTFFALRSADAFLFEGRREEALKICAGIREKLRRGEGHAMATLALAEAFALPGDEDSLIKAERLYRDILDAESSAEAARAGLIPVEIRLGKFEEASKDIEAFQALFPISPLRAEIQNLRGQLAVKWIEALSSAEDHYGVIKIFSRYRSNIPLGYRAEVFLRAGKSFASLDLLPDAASSLDGAIRLGKDATAEGAIITLAGVYLRQGDTQAAERLVAGFKSRFPKSPYAKDAEEMLLKAAFLKGDYKKAAEAKGHGGNPEVLLLKAASLSKLKRFREAEAAYSDAVKVSAEKGDMHTLYSAYMGLGDSYFMTQNYQAAIDGYKKAIENIKEEGAEDRSWALYRIAQSYSRLNKRPEKEKTVEELKGVKNELGAWAAPIFSEPARHL